METSTLEFGLGSGDLFQHNRRLCSRTHRLHLIWTGENKPFEMHLCVVGALFIFSLSPHKNFNIKNQKCYCSKPD